MRLRFILNSKWFKKVHFPVYNTTFCKLNYVHLQVYNLVNVTLYHVGVNSTSQIIFRSLFMSV